MHVQFAEDLRSIQEMGVIDDSADKVSNGHPRTGPEEEKTNVGE